MVDISRRGFIGIFGASVPIAKALTELPESRLPSLPVIGTRKKSDPRPTVLEYETVRSAMCYARVERTPSGGAKLVNNMGFRFLWADGDRVRLYYDGKWQASMPAVNIQASEFGHVPLILMDDAYCVEVRLVDMNGSGVIGGFDIMVQIPILV